MDSASVPFSYSVPISYSVKIAIHNNILVNSLMAVYLSFIFCSAILSHSRVTQSKPNTVLAKEAMGPVFERSTKALCVYARDLCVNAQT